jgi:hypothetical protein
MKKIMIFAAMLLSTSGIAFGANDDDQPIRYDELPAAAQNFIAENFAKEQVSHMTFDDGLINDEYKVVFMSGTKLEFDGNGNWKELDCRYTEVPNTLVPTQIADYVKSNYPGSKITELKREHGEWEAKITGGLELTFDQNFKLVDIDD